MSFFAEMKMRGDGVLEQMNQKVANQDKEQRVFPPEMHGFRDDFDERDAQHIARPKREKIL